MKKWMLVLSAIVAAVFLFETGCVTSDDPDKRKKRALAGGATSTALGIATGVGGPILAARAALGAAGRVVTGDTMDAIKAEDNEGSEQPAEAYVK
ncbi:MAG: hypothetical protein HY584_04715 [Candidatus Omnitrophica bacterium]|nr:hypothetical protein [Candidatus Omnitrophota bacterium]